MEIERREYKWGVKFSVDNVDGEAFSDLMLADKKEQGTVNWWSIGSVTPAYARSFAARVIAVADAVDAEVERIKGGTPCAE